MLSHIEEYSRLVIIPPYLIETGALDLLGSNQRIIDSIPHCVISSDASDEVSRALIVGRYNQRLKSELTIHPVPFAVWIVSDIRKIEKLGECHFPTT